MSSNLMRSHPVSKDVKIASILFALFVDIQTLNLIISAARPSLAGSLMSVMYAVVVVFLFFIGIVVQKRSFLKLSVTHIGICLLCVLWYAVTFTFVSPPSVPVLFFLIFTVASFVIPGIIRVDMHTFLLTLITLPSIGVLYVDKIFVSEILETGSVSMGTCYALLVPVLGNLVYLKYFYNIESLRMKIVIIFFAAINIYYLLQITMFGSRGPILCVLLLIVSFFIIKIDAGKIVVRKGRILLIIIGGLLLLLSFKMILHDLKVLFATFDISINAIDKFLRLDETGDMTNGREVLSSMAWKGFVESPLWGNGTSQFFNNTGAVYPHNFILQLLYDGGVILSLCVIVPIIRTLKHKILVASESEFICLLLLFFASVPGSLFSGDLWNSGVLWLFFGLVLSKNTVVASCE